MSELIDISLRISPTSVVWPTAPQPVLTRRHSITNGDRSNDSNLFMNVHTGTHVDAPLHHFNDGASADQIPLGHMIGEAWVLDLKNRSVIDIPALEQVWPSSSVTRILCRTDNSSYWKEEQKDFVTDFCALAPETAEWLLAKSIQLVGMDYLSVQRYGDVQTVHQVLLKAGVVLVEGVNLSEVEPGRYELLCLPLRLANADGAPARVVLRKAR